jgi:hypothetical protein
MQSVEEFMQQFFEARNAGEKREQANLARLLTRFYSGGWYLGGRVEKLESFESEKVLSISSAGTNSEVITSRQLPGEPECKYETRYRLQANGGDWQICGIDLQCCPCDGKPGRSACPNCHGTGWIDTLEIITEEIEERWDREWLVEMDKSWDAIHRCLGDGSLRTSQKSIASKAVLGGRQLSSSSDWIISYLTVDEVKQVAVALASIDQPEFRRRYFALKKRFLWFNLTQYAGPINDDDFNYS